MATKKRKEIHTKKWRDMVKAIKKKGGAVSPEAVASARLGKKSFLKKSRGKSSRGKSGKSKQSKVAKLKKISKSRKRKKRR